MKQLLPFICLLISTNITAQTSSAEIVNKEFLLGKILYEKNPEFVKVEKAHTTGRIYLNRATYAAFAKMFEAAKMDGIQLQIISGARNFEHQKIIWEKKWKALKELDPLCRSQKILEFSSMPATSRHHWGTDVDLNNLDNSYFEEGTGKAVYDWLVQNAPRYGFYQVYTSKQNGRTGYSEEKWHWSYLPLARDYLQAYNEKIRYEDITGFEGAHLAEIQQMIAAYVNGVSHEPVEAFTETSKVQTVFTQPED